MDDGRGQLGINKFTANSKWTLCGWVLSGWTDRFPCSGTVIVDTSRQVKWFDSYLTINKPYIFLHDAGLTFLQSTIYIRLNKMMIHGCYKANYWWIRYYRDSEYWQSYSTGQKRVHRKQFVWHRLKCYLWKVAFIHWNKMLHSCSHNNPPNRIVKNTFR